MCVLIWMVLCEQHFLVLRMASQELVSKCKYNHIKIQNLILLRRFDANSKEFGFAGGVT